MRTNEASDRKLIEFLTSISFESLVFFIYIAPSNKVCNARHIPFMQFCVPRGKRTMDWETLIYNILHTGLLL